MDHDLLGFIAYRAIPWYSLIPLSDSICSPLVDPETGTALIHLSGAITGHQIAACAVSLHADPAWSHHNAAIWDARALLILDVTPEGLDEMVEAQANGELGPDIVISNNEDHVGLLRLYAWRVRGQGRPAEVCTTLEQALALLGMKQLPAALEVAV